MRLNADSLTVERGGETVLAGLSFAVAAGEALVVTGENGAGKTTLLRVVAGLLPRQSGRVDLEGLAAGIETVGEACHYLGHANGMKRDLTVGENLRFWRDAMAGTYSGWPASDIEAATAGVGLERLIDLPFGYLSAGQQRRIALARLLVSHRPVWLLDEPTTALDGAADSLFCDLVERHLERGGLALIATHRPLDLERQSILHLETAGRTKDVLA